MSLEKFNPTYPDLLRALAVLIEEHQLISPYTVTNSDVSIHSYDSEALTQMAAWRRALGGTWDKRDGGSTIHLIQEGVASLPGSPDVTLFIGKNSSVRKVVGTEIVKVPAVKAQPATTETRDIVEWDCEPVLAGVNA